MSVYVDRSRNHFRGMIMCHMIADTPEELHAMAINIGLKLDWFQANASTPHYDVCQTKRAKAIQLGALDLDRNDFVAVIRRLRAAGGPK